MTYVCTNIFQHRGILLIDGWEVLLFSSIPRWVIKKKKEEVIFTLFAHWQMARPIVDTFTLFDLLVPGSESGTQFSSSSRSRAPQLPSLLTRERDGRRRRISSSSDEDEGGGGGWDNEGDALSPPRFQAASRVREPKLFQLFFFRITDSFQSFF